MIVTEKSKVIPIVAKSGKHFTLTIDGSCYHAKKVTEYRMINELIGSYFSKKIGLDSVDYEIGKYGKDLYALSKDFNEEGYEYTSFKRYFMSLFSQEPENRRLRFFSFLPPKYVVCRVGGLNFLRSTPMYEDALKLIAVDLRMGQIDRNNSNLQLKISSTREASFAKIYDYSESYIHGAETTLYRSPYVAVRRNNLSLTKLVKEHPQVWDYVNFLLDISIIDALNQIGDDKEILYNGNEMVNFLKCQRLIDRQLKKVKVKRLY